MKCKHKKIAEKHNQSYRSVIKTSLPKEQTRGWSKHARRDERFLSLAQMINFTTSLSEICL